MTTMRVSNEHKMLVNGRYNWDNLTEKFYKNKETKGTKSNTIANYRRHLSLIRPILEEQSADYVMDIRTIDLFAVEDVQSKLLEDRKPSTVIGMMKSLKQFMEYCRKHKLIDENVLDDLDLVKKNKVDNYTPITEEVERIKKVLYKNIKSVEQMKFATAIDLILQTANRISETMAIRWQNLDEEALTITLDSETTKNGNTNVKFVSEEMMEKLLALKQYYPNNPYVFCNRNGNISHRNNVEKWFNRKLEEANVNDRITFHSLRRYVITDAIERGIPIEYVSKYLANHSSISITMEKYYKPTSDKAENEIRAKLLAVH